MNPGTISECNAGCSYDALSPFSLGGAPTERGGYSGSAIFEVQGPDD